MKITMSSSGGTLRTIPLARTLYCKGLPDFIKKNKRPVTDGEFGLQVIKILDIIKRELNAFL